MRTYYRGEERPDYGRIQAILIGVVGGYIIILSLIGPEDFASNFEEAKAATVEGAGRNECTSAAVSRRRKEAGAGSQLSEFDVEKQQGDAEKQQVIEEEHAEHRDNRA